MLHLENYALNVLLLAACATPAGVTGVPGSQPGAPVTIDTTFAAVFVPGIPAVTYDPMLVPETGKVRVTLTGDGKVQEITLGVAGLEPNHVFGAHLHTNECGPSGSDAGPHYQHAIDPAATADRASTDPEYANPSNEVWLDFTTDTNGVGSASTVHPWPFDPSRAPRSLIIHAHQTDTQPGHAGMAGDRLACVNLQ